MAPAMASRLSLSLARLSMCHFCDPRSQCFLQPCHPCHHRLRHLQIFGVRKITLAMGRRNHLRQRFLKAADLGQWRA